MTGKKRSPKYPMLGLPEALKQIELVWSKNQMHAAPREVIAKALGYNTLHGKSLRLIAALIQYGLLEQVGKELRVSQLAMQYLHPESEEEKKAALRKAAAEPALFGRLEEKFPGGTPSDELVLNYLARQRFLPQAAQKALRAYRDTIEFVEKECGYHNEDHSSPGLDDDAVRQHAPPAAPGPPANPSNIAPGNFRVAMDGEFLVEIHGSGLYQESVDRLAKWLAANRELVPKANRHAPDAKESGAGEDDQ